MRTTRQAATLGALLLVLVTPCLAAATGQPAPVLRAGGGRAHAPFHFLDDHGRLSGFDIELLEAVVKVIGRQAEIHLGHWQQARRELQSGELDLLVGMTHTDVRDETMLFSVPTLTKSYRIVVRSGDGGITGADDLDGKQIIAQRAGPMEQLARAHSSDLVLVDTGAQGLRLLASGRSDCYLGADYRVMFLIRELGIDGLARIGDPVLTAPYGFAAAKGQEELIRQLNRGIELVRRSGEYDRIFRRWFVALEPGETGPGLAALIASWVLLPVLGVLVLSVAWVWSLRRQVLARTADLKRELERRLEAETALRATEEQFSEAFRLSPEPIVILSVSDHRIIEVNHAFAEVTGYQRHELIGSNAIDSGIWNDPEPLVQASECGDEGRPAHNIEMLLRHRSGASRTCLCSIVRVRLGTQPCLLLIAADTTERKLLEAQLTQTSKMEALGQLAGGIAHDFNNLLSVIQGYCELTLLLLTEGSTEWHHLSTILDAATRGSDLTRQMLAFSRQQKQNPVPIDLNTVVRNTKPMIRRLISERVLLRYLLRDNLGLVEVDPGQISQVIMNLVINARDAMPGGGTITIETSLKEQEGEGDGSQPPSAAGGRYIALEVHDAGQGIDPETLPHIFEPFFTTKPEGEGTGLGLATVYGIVRQSGGQIEVESQPDQGATFRVLLPLAEETATVTTVSRRFTLPIGGDETILLVEDEPQICKLVETTLADLGYQVVATTDPFQALQHWQQRQGRIDLLLTDVVMPGMDGMELVKAIREENAGAKVLFISGYVDDPRLLEAVAQNDATLLAKPFTISTLAQHVRQVLDQPRSDSTRTTEPPA